MRGHFLIVAIIALVIGQFPLLGGAQAGDAFNLAFAIGAADFNRDGALDLAVAITRFDGPPNSGFVSVILQNPAARGTFFKGAHYPIVNDPIAMAVGDLNDDGLPDLVVASATSEYASVLLQDRNNPGVFLPATRVFIGQVQSGIAIGDLNGDGLPDIAAAVNTRNLKILFANPAGPPGSYLDPVDVRLNGAAGAVAIGDLDGDGANDLVVALTARSQVAVLLQDARTPGTFLAENDFPVGLQPFAVKIGDIDGDGIPDLVTADFGPAAGTGGGVSVLLQDATNRGSFAAAQRYHAGLGPEDVAIGDLNGDGRADLGVANFGKLVQSGDQFEIRTSVSVLLQKAATKGDLVFGGKNVQLRDDVTAVALGDFDGDGKQDVAVAKGPGASIMFQKRNTPGAFLPPRVVGR